MGSRAVQRQRLDRLHAGVFAPGMSEGEQAARVLLYLAARDVSWLATLWHDARRIMLGISYGTPECSETEFWRRFTEQ